MTHNLPLIRDRLVSIFSAQTDEIVSSAEGKEYLRIYALAEINKALLQVQGLATPPTTSSAAEASTTPTSTPASSPASLSAAPATPVPATVSLPVVTPVKGPASDLYFNNFVVQK